jgi:murein DD-endopeptidase MepM/ murein hydrolase activator NlpD
MATKNDVRCFTRVCAREVLEQALLETQSLAARRLRLLAAGAMLLVAGFAVEAASYSSGNYRIPYDTGTRVTVLTDHLTHVPPDRVDLVGEVDTNTFTPNRIVAAADGVVRFIQDSYTLSCPSCSVSNNYVWLQHSNGEWTKYSYLRTGTVRGAAALAEGDTVTAGQYLGDEGNIGATTLTNLHFEVAVPDDSSDPIYPAGGFIKGVNRIPVICGLPSNVFVAGKTYTANPCHAPELAQGVYRLPYVNGTEVKVNFDHLTHYPVPTRLDLKGTGGRSPYHVAAAADGVIRAIVDNHTKTGACSDNNYVWLEHPNGEWTKYTHMQTGSVTTNAGLRVGQTICAGTYIGDEDDVGCADGVHLHWEVAVPTDPVTPFDVSGGYINGFNRIPVVCGIPGNILIAGQTYPAQPCGSSDCAGKVLLPPMLVYGTQAVLSSDEIDSNNSDFRVDTFASVGLRAAHRVTLRPGFRAAWQSYFQAAIRDCNEMQRMPGCQLTLP